MSEAPGGAEADRLVQKALTELVGADRKWNREQQAQRWRLVRASHVAIYGLAAWRRAVDRAIAVVGEQFIHDRDALIHG